MAKFRVPLEVAETLRNMRDTKEWAAIKVLFDIYVQFRKDVVWGMDKNDPNLSQKFAEETGGAIALKYITNFVDKELARQSDESL